MVRVQRAQDFFNALPDDAAPQDNLREADTLDDGAASAMSSQNSSLRATLMANKAYMDGLIEVSDRPAPWIDAAQARREIGAALPPIRMYPLYARACDPVLELRSARAVSRCCTAVFEGLNARRARRRSQRTSSRHLTVRQHLRGELEPITRLASAPWECEPMSTNAIGYRLPGMPHLPGGLRVE